MAEKEVVLMKGNEAIAHAAIRCGCDGYFGYPITPQSEVLETLALEKPWETTGMVVLQAESEVASINMVYGAGAAGKRSMTSLFKPRRGPDARRHRIHGRSGNTGTDCQRAAGRPRTGYHTAQPIRLLPGDTRRRKR